MQNTAFLRSCCVAGMTASTLLALPACTNTISLPTADNTPPNVELVVSREPLGRAAITRIVRPGGNAIELDICPDDTLVLRANGRDDDGGILSVGVQGSATGTCAQGNPAQPIGQIVSGSPAAAGNSVPTERTVAQNVPVVDFACASGSIPNPLIATVTGSASNYYGGTVTTSPVTLRYPPVSFSCSGDPCFVPLNATFVSSHNESCSETDSVQVNQHVPREIISAGECKAFKPRPDAHPVPWWCVGPGSPIPGALSPNNTTCGAGANFIRVSRNATGSSFRIDCFQVP